MYQHGIQLVKSSDLPWRQEHVSKFYRWSVARVWILMIKNDILQINLYADIYDKIYDPTVNHDVYLAPANPLKTWGPSY